MNLFDSEKQQNCQTQNFKLNSLVNMSNVEAVEKARKERDDAVHLAAEERQKTNAIRNNAKNEIAKANRKAKENILEAQNKIRFLQMASVGIFVIGLVIGWFL